MTKTRKPKRNAAVDAALLDMAKDGLLSGKLSEKITLRILGENALPKPAPLSPEQIRAIRERAGVSQAVFARLLNLTTGYVSELERGAKRPTGAALALLHVVRRKGIDALAP
jgi:putative transcriptional regulator